MIATRKTSKIKSLWYGARSSLLRLKRQMKKDWMIFFSDKNDVFLAFVLPPFMMFLFAFVSQQTASSTIAVNTVIVSYDSNQFVNENNYTSTYYNYTQQESNETIPLDRDDYAIPYLESAKNSESLNVTNFYNATEEPYAMDDARAALKNGEVECIIQLPVEFSELILWGYPGVIECVIDASSVTGAQNIINAIYDSIKSFAEENDLYPQFELDIEEEYSVPGEYNFMYNWGMTIMISLVVFGIARGLTILIVVRDSPAGRLLLTPVKRYEILLSKYIVYTTIMAIQLFLVLAVVVLGGYYVAGSLVDLYITLFIIGMLGLSFSLLVSIISKTETDANQIVLGIFIIVFLLSGIFISIESMPPYLQIIANILPLSHGEPIVNGISTKGKGFLGYHFTWLISVLAAAIALSFVLFSRRKYEV